jgi:hypothetical protein
LRSGYSNEALANYLPLFKDFNNPPTKLLEVWLYELEGLILNILKNRKDLDETQQLALISLMEQIEKKIPGGMDLACGYFIRYVKDQTIYQSVIERLGILRDKYINSTDSMIASFGSVIKQEFDEIKM